MEDAILTALSSGAKQGNGHGAPNLLDLFWEQVKATPQATAVEFDRETLTYSELNAKAERLARSLVELGVGPDVVVGLYVKRSPWFVVGALGILKAGGAYLPLDCSFPLDHSSYILNDAQVSLVVTEQSLAGSPLFSDGSLTLVEIDSSESIEGPVESTPRFFEPDNLAYVIYTSGSTGKPKGVEITHRGLWNLVEWHQSAFGVKASDRATQFASVSFDAAVWELWPYLTAGASIHFVPDRVRIDPESLRDWLVQNRISIGFVPTPLAESLIAFDWPANTALRMLLTGADTLHRYPSPGLPFQLVNNYGPTECSVVATSGTISPLNETADLPTIGRPIKNTRIYLLNERLQPVAAGESGEVFIGGDGLARGYRNRPDLTAQQFIANPFHDDSDDRLYRTGDLARILPDGQFAFLGRVDDQIKISGYRIEPQQIVRAMETHPSVETSAVVARDDAQSSKKLVAYLVPKRGAKLNGSELRGFLERRLPPYMVPVIFVCLERLPLTANGKIDRSALPAPGSSNILGENTASDARNPVEERLARILGRLLGLDLVGVDDNFFNLGGHSLLATQLIARIRDEFRVDLGLRTVFDTPTVAGLAAKIEEAIFSKVAAMSEEEAQQLLNQMTQQGLESSAS